MKTIPYVWLIDRRACVATYARVRRGARLGEAVAAHDAVNKRVAAVLVVAVDGDPPRHAVSRVRCVVRRELLRGRRAAEIAGGGHGDHLPAASACAAAAGARPAGPCMGCD